MARAESVSLRRVRSSIVAERRGSTFISMQVEQVAFILV